MLHVLEEWFGAIFERAKDGIVLADAESKKLLLGNDAFCRLLGYTREEIKELSILDLYPKENQSYVVNMYYRHEEVAPASFPVKSKNGSTFYADFTTAYLKIGGASYLAVFFRGITERMQTEQLFRVGGTDFTAIFEHSPIAMVVSMGVEEKVLMVNQKFTELFGYALEDTYDLHRWWAFSYPNEKYRLEIKAEWAKRVEQAIQNLGKIEPLETSFTCKDGSRRYVRFSFASTGSKNIVTCEDLTIRKYMETALRESEGRYRGIFNAVDDIIFTVEMDGRLSSISPSFERMTEWLADEWVGKHFSLLVYQDDQERVQELFERLLSGEAISAFHMRLVMKTGKYLETEVKSVAIRNNGSITVFGVLRDITERKRVEELMRRRLTYENLLSRISIMALTDKNLNDFLEQSIAIMGKVVAVSRSYLFEHCYETDSMDNTQEWCATGITPQKLNMQRLPSSMAPWWVEALKSGQNICFTDIERIADENVKEILRLQGVYSILVVPLFVDGYYYGFIGFDDCLQHRKWPQEDVDVLLSISRIIAVVIERKLAEEKIHQLNEELEIKVQKRTKQLLSAQEVLMRKEKLSILGQVAGSVGHELRNPLGVMSNAVYFLQTVLSDADSAILEYLDIIKSEISVADRIVGDLLDSVRVKPPHPEIVAVAQLIEQSLKKCTIPPSVIVKLDIPESLPPIKVDPMQIHQVFRNLINNGIEAMQEGGELEIIVATKISADLIRISVKDSGVGISSDELGKLFQPLFTTKARGIGLGLVVVKNLTQANGGKVEVESKLGVGSTFAITLPISSEGMQRMGSAS